MSEPESKPNRLNTIAGVVGLATAVLGLVGAGMAFFGGDKPEKAEAEAVALASENLSDVPDRIDGYLSGPAFAEMWSRHTLCYDWRPQDESCQLTGKVSQRGARAIRATETQYVLLPQPAFMPLDMIVVSDVRAQNKPAPIAFAQVREVDYRLTREGLCTTNAEREAGVGRIQVFATAARGGDLVPLSVSGLTAYRAELAQQYRTEAIGDRQCWRFRLEPGEPVRIRQDYFIDDVLQPAQTLTFSMLPLEQAVYLHIPDA